MAELERMAGGAAANGARLAAACPTLAGAPGVAAACAPAIPSARSLSVTWQQQKTGYWCGPATVAMASGYFKNPKSQADVAKKIGTTTAGSDRLQVRNGLKWVSGVAYEAISAPSAEQLMVIFRANIGRNGHPFAVNTREEARDRHYNMHPNRGIGHFVLATGYTNEGRTGRMHDPAAGLKGGYENSAKTFTLSVTDIAFFTAKRGVVA